MKRNRVCLGCSCPAGFGDRLKFSMGLTIENGLDWTDT